MSKYEGLEEVAKAAFKTVAKKNKKAVDPSFARKQLNKIESFWGQAMDEKFPEPVLLTNPRATSKQRKQAQDQLREYIMERGFADTQEAKQAFRADATKAAKLRKMLEGYGDE
jgi:hypothetical protein